MEYYCSACGKWYNSKEAEQIIAINRNDNMGIIAPVFCPNCGDKGYEVYIYQYTGRVDRVAYTNRAQLALDYSLTLEQLDGLVQREVDTVHEMNPIRPLNLLEQLEVLEQQSLFSDGR